VTTRTIKVEYLARVEGEGALHVRVEKGELKEVALKIFEPPRFFEAMLRGRDFTEAPDITARICGICPVAYQMSAVHALERICGVKVEGTLRALRRLLYCGEWIESHVLHIYMLHAPDFLGVPDVVTIAQSHPELVKRALQLKKAGNDIVRVLGGREIHPINVRVGGFYRAPSRTELRALLPSLEAALEVAQETVDFAATLDFPDLERDYLFTALQHDDEYAYSEGRIRASDGLDIDADEWDAHFEEVHVERSTALHARRRDSGRSYLVGPMARFALGYERLRPAAREAAARVGLTPPEKNPFKSILVRAVEVVHAVDEAISIIEGYEAPEASFVEVTPRAGVGRAVTEAPRGSLYHRYELGEDGKIVDAVIAPPTSQNQSTIEADLREVVPMYLKAPKAEMQHVCEQAIRNYDPCISCSTHFLDLQVEET
jgi:coenzyme F420-reducing hydrogenase alpha subunit